MKTIKASKVRTAEDIKNLRDSVTDIIDKVVTEGDNALKEFGRQFDNSDRETIRVSSEEIQAAYEKVDDVMLADIKAAAANIRAFAEEQKKCVTELRGFAPAPGMDLGHRVIPIQSACCYVPGGGYPLYSTALMLAIPAKVAGVERVCACSPVIKGSGDIHPYTLVAMDVAGVDEIYAVGGAQAIAAFSYGTDEIKPVDIIVGPGNRFVTEAKRQCYGKVGIDFVAGPSEVLIISDGTGDPAVMAADILAQSEHDPIAKGMLVTTDEIQAKAVIAEVEKQLDVLETAGIARQSWNDYGEILLADSLEEAIAYTNDYAPEHLEVNVAAQAEEATVEALRNYGSLFIGQNTAEVFGDYASGTNHTLPTLGAARYTGGVWVGTFLKVCTYQRFTKDAMLGLAPLVSRLAHGEGLKGHANAAEIRMKK